MKFAPGFDQRHRGIHLVIIALIAISSILMLVANIFFGADSEGMGGRTGLLCSLASSVGAILGYFLLDKFNGAFVIVGSCAFLFSIAIWSVGLANVFPIYMGVMSLVMAVVSLCVRGSADLSDVSSGE